MTSFHEVVEVGDAAPDFSQEVGCVHHQGGGRRYDSQDAGQDLQYAIVSIADLVQMILARESSEYVFYFNDNCEPEQKDNIF